jgi:hypothetical protein
MISPSTISYKSLYEDSEQKRVQLEVKVMELSHQLQQLKKMISGSKSKNFIVSNDAVSQQPSLFDIPEEGASCSVIDTKKVAIPRRRLSNHPLHIRDV